MKIYERVIKYQLTDIMQTIFNPYLFAFKSYDRQATLLKMVEDWNLSLTENQYVGAILMDLTTALDCLTHNLIILNLKRYRLSEIACNLMLDFEKPQVNGQK